MFCLYCKKDNIVFRNGEYKAICDECSAEYIECNLCCRLTHMDYLVYRPDLFGMPEDSTIMFPDCEICYSCRSKIIPINSY